MAIHNKYFWLCCAIALMVCIAQILGSTILILGCLALFLGITGVGCTRSFTLPILLFFLPWSQILRTSPDTFSFFTFALVLVCLVSILKGRLRFRRYHLTVGFLLLTMTLISKLLDGSFLAFNYIAFFMMIFLFPVVKEEWTGGEYDFFEVVFFFAAGTVMAALCAQQFSVYPNIARYINIHSYLNIIRMSGFYGDPNFYTAQITAALAGCLVTSLKEQTRRRVVTISLMAVLLIYCGFLSGSKSFVLIAAAVLLLWAVEMMRMRGSAGRKIILMAGGVLVALFIATSALFSGLIEVLITRFSFSTDLSSFTTGRLDLWGRYLLEILGDAKILLLGKGFTDVLLDGRAPHSTLIQAVFQFGIVGVPLLLAWSIGFFGDLGRGKKKAEDWMRSGLILIAGVFAPWLALDILFFDEFFLLQWYAFAGLCQLRCGYSTGAPQQGDTERPRKRRPVLRFVWR